MIKVKLCQTYVFIYSPINPNYNIRLYGKFTFIITLHRIVLNCCVHSEKFGVIQQTIFCHNFG